MGGMWENWSLVGFLITPVVVSVYVRESEVESKTVRESQGVRGGKRESVTTYKTRDRFVSAQSEQNTEGCA